MAELSRLLTVKSSLHVTCIPLMVSPPLPLYSHALNSIFIFGMKNNTQSIWKLIYIFLSICIFCPMFNPGGTKEKSLKGKKSYTLIVPRRQRQVENVGKRKEKWWRYSASRGAWYTVGGQWVPLSPYSCIPSCRFPEVLFEDPALFPALSPITLTLNNTQLDTGTKFV